MYITLIIRVLLVVESISECLSVASNRHYHTKSRIPVVTTNSYKSQLKQYNATRNKNTWVPLNGKSSTDSQFDIGPMPTIGPTTNPITPQYSIGERARDRAIKSHKDSKNHHSQQNSPFTIGITGNNPLLSFSETPFKATNRLSSFLDEPSPIIPYSSVLKHDSQIFPTNYVKSPASSFDFSGLKFSDKHSSDILPTFSPSLESNLGTFKPFPPFKFSIENMLPTISTSPSYSKGNFGGSENNLKVQQKNEATKTDLNNQKPLKSLDNYQPLSAQPQLHFHGNPLVGIQHPYGHSQYVSNNQGVGNNKYTSQEGNLQSTIPSFNPNNFFTIPHTAVVDAYGQAFSKYRLIPQSEVITTDGLHQTAAHPPTNGNNYVEKQNDQNYFHNNQSPEISSTGSDEKYSNASEYDDNNSEISEDKGKNKYRRDPGVRIKNKPKLKVTNTFANEFAEDTPRIRGSAYVDGSKKRRISTSSDDRLTRARDELSPGTTSKYINNRNSDKDNPELCGESSIENDDDDDDQTYVVTSPSTIEFGNKIFHQQSVELPDAHNSESHETIQENGTSHKLDLSNERSNG